MEIYVDKTDQFMELLDIVKPGQIFVNKYSEVTENKLLHGYIFLQFATAEDVINHRFVESIPQVQLPPVDTFFNMAAKFIDEPAVKKAGEKLDDDIKTFYKKLDDAYADALKIFKERDMTVIDGYIK